MTSTIDAHQHFWAYNDREYGWMGPNMDRLRRDHLPEDLAPLLTRAGVDGTVAVQARRSVAETEWLLALADRNPFVLGVVGWVPFGAPTLGAELERLAAHPRLVGVRELIHDMPDAGYAASREHARGVARLHERGLAYDLLLRTAHLPAATRLVDAFPEQRFVIDHIAKPVMRAGARPSHGHGAAWAEGIRALAERPNVWCKLSGLVTEADWHTWTREDVAPFAEVVLEAFGAQRVMFGTDWPVCTCAATYPTTVALARALVSELSDAEQADVLGGTARRFYGLQEAPRRGPETEDA